MRPGVELDETTATSDREPGRSVLPVFADPTSELEELPFLPSTATPAWLPTNAGSWFGAIHPSIRGSVTNSTIFRPIRARRPISSKDPGFAGELTRLVNVLDGYFGRYEDPNKSGTRIMEQPPANGREPWTRVAESLNPPE